MNSISVNNLKNQALDFSFSVAKRSVQVASAVALPAIALYASTYAQGAEAGPVSGVACAALAGAVVVLGPPGPWTVGELQTMYWACKFAAINPFWP